TALLFIPALLWGSAAIAAAWSVAGGCSLSGIPAGSLLLLAILLARFPVQSLSTTCCWNPADQRLGFIPAFRQIPSSRHLKLSSPRAFRRCAEKVSIGDADARGLLWTDLKFEPQSFPIKMKRHSAS